MATPNTSEIDSAVLARLSGDPTLTGHMPDGVWMSTAPPGAKRFVIISTVIHFDEGVFGQRGFEEITYLVKAVGLSSANPNMKAAYGRIDELLENATLNVPGFVFMECVRDGGYFRLDDVDEIDASIRWVHRGARYRVRCAWPDHMRVN